VAGWCEVPRTVRGGSGRTERATSHRASGASHGARTSPANSLFLDDDGLLIGYYETDSVADADAALAASEVAAAWEAHMQDLFAGATGRADQTARVLPEVFNLEDQLAAAPD
jgi:L-rhamnose mutarotase